MHNPLTCSIFLVSNGFECNAVDYFKKTTNLEMGNLHLVQEQLARQDIQSGIKLLNKEKPWIRTQKKKKRPEVHLCFERVFQSTQNSGAIPPNSCPIQFDSRLVLECEIAAKQDPPKKQNKKKKPTKCTRSRIGFLPNASKNNTPKELTENPKTHSRPRQQQTAADFFKKQSWKLVERKTRERKAKVKTTHITRKERKKERIKKKKTEAKREPKPTATQKKHNNEIT